MCQVSRRDTIRPGRAEPLCHTPNRGEVVPPPVIATSGRFACEVRNTECVVLRPTHRLSPHPRHTLVQVEGHPRDFLGRQLAAQSNLDRPAFESVPLPANPGNDHRRPGAEQNRRQLAAFLHDTDNPRSAARMTTVQDACEFFVGAHPCVGLVQEKRRLPGFNGTKDTGGFGIGQDQSAMRHRLDSFEQG